LSQHQAEAFLSNGLEIALPERLRCMLHPNRTPRKPTRMQLLLCVCPIAVALAVQLPNPIPTPTRFSGCRGPSLSRSACKCVRGWCRGAPVEPTNHLTMVSKARARAASGHTSRDGAIRDVGHICPQVDGYPRTAPPVDAFSCPLLFEPSPRGHGALVRRCHAAGAPLQSARPWQCAASTMEKSLRSRDFRTATKLTSGTHSIRRPAPLLYLPVLHSRHERHCRQLSMRRCQGNDAAPSAARGGCVLSTRRRASMICRFVRARTDGKNTT
jgi:hypothetical protein